MDLSSFLPGLFNAGISAYTANKAAGNLQQAGQAAAQQAAFRPVGITTRFGRTGFQYGPDGRLIGAGYQLAPDVAAMREATLGLAGGGLQQALDAQRVQQAINQAGVGLFNLGAGYVAQTPQKAAEQYMTQQRQLLAPGREQQFAQLMNQQFQRGRSGLATGATQAGFQAGAPGLQATNPQMAAYYNALAQQDAALAAQAQQAGMRQAEFGQGLMGGAINLVGKGYGLQEAALSPFRTSFGLGQMVEQAGGAGPLEMSRVLGGGNPAAAQALLSSGMSAAGVQEDYMRGAAKGLNDPIAQLIGALTSRPTNPIMANANPYLDQQNFNALMAYGGL